MTIVVYMDFSKYLLQLLLIASIHDADISHCTIPCPTTRNKLYYLFVYIDNMA